VLFFRSPNTTETHPPLPAFPALSPPSPGPRTHPCHKTSPTHSPKIRSPALFPCSVSRLFPFPPFCAFLFPCMDFTRVSVSRKPCHFRHPSSPFTWGLHACLVFLLADFSRPLSPFVSFLPFRSLCASPRSPQPTPNSLVPNWCWLAMIGPHGNMRWARLLSFQHFLVSKLNFL